MRIIIELSEEESQAREKWMRQGDNADNPEKYDVGFHYLARLVFGEAQRVMPVEYKFQCAGVDLYYDAFGIAGYRYTLAGENRGDEEDAETCDCRGRGWYHWNDPYGIENCIDCCKYESLEAAVEAHDRECGCHWGKAPVCTCGAVMVPCDDQADCWRCDTHDDEIPPTRHECGRHRGSAEMCPKCDGMEEPEL
jgi:hypothetical protein